MDKMVTPPHVTSRLWCLTCLIPYNNPVMKTSARRTFNAICICAVCYFTWGILRSPGIQHFKQYILHHFEPQLNLSATGLLFESSAQANAKQGQFVKLKNGLDDVTSDSLNVSGHRSLEFCNLPSDLKAAEGLHNEEVELVSVHILFRHGMRASMGNSLAEMSFEQPDCNFPALSMLHSNNAITKRFLNAMSNLGNHSLNSLWKQLITDFGTHPNSHACRKSQLTNIGTSQMLLLGSHLRTAYRNVMFLPEFNSNKLTKPEIKLTVTEYSRTVQSSIAFIYGFLEDQFSLSLVDISTSKGIYFCNRQLSEVPCYCKAANKKPNSRVPKSNKSAEAELEQTVYKNLIQMFQYFHMKRIPHLSEMIDILMPIVCSGKMPHCFPSWKQFEDIAWIEGIKACFPLSFLDEMWQVLDNENKQNMLTDGIIHHHRLLIYPLLKEISLKFLGLSQGMKVPKFVFYHGHDHTITSFLIALDIYDNKWPPYASRVTLETYKVRNGVTLNNLKKSLTQSSIYLLRLLYNGKDVTDKPHWCQQIKLNDGAILCTLQSFLTFLLDSQSSYFITGSYASDCDIV